MAAGVRGRLSDDRIGTHALALGKARAALSIARVEDVVGIPPELEGVVR